jgi:hypothetical protein
MHPQRMGEGEVFIFAQRWLSTLSYWKGSSTSLHIMYNKQEEVFIVCFFAKKIKIYGKSLKKLSYNERRKKGNKQRMRQWVVWVCQLWESNEGHIFYSYNLYLIFCFSSTNTMMMMMMKNVKALFIHVYLSSLVHGCYYICATFCCIIFLPFFYRVSWVSFFFFVALSLCACVCVFRFCYVRYCVSFVGNLKEILTSFSLTGQLEIQK